MKYKDNDFSASKVWTSSSFLFNEDKVFDGNSNSVGGEKGDELVVRDTSSSGDETGSIAISSSDDDNDDEVVETKISNDEVCDVKVDVRGIKILKNDCSTFLDYKDINFSTFVILSWIVGRIPLIYLAICCVLVSIISLRANSLWKFVVYASTNLFYSL